MEPVGLNSSGPAPSSRAPSSDGVAEQASISAKNPSYIKRSASNQKLNTLNLPKQDLESADLVIKASTRPQSAWVYIHSGVWARPLAAVAALYLFLVLTLIVMIKRLPTRDALSEKAQLPADTLLLLKLPRNVTELRAVRHTLELYRQNYSIQVALLLVSAYLVMQSLSIPGSIGINLLMGSMYSFPVAFVTIALTSTLGACLNYSISWFLVKDIIKGLFYQRVSWFSKQVGKRRENLLAYFIFLRISPLLPSWFINLASPIVSIPFKTFALGSFIGLQPLNFISVSAGRTLGQMQSMSDLYSIRTLLIMMICALLALLPTMLKQLARRHSRLGGGRLRPANSNLPIL